MDALLFGDLEIRSLCGGRFRLDGGAMFGLIPKPLWEVVAPPDPQNRIDLACNCLLIRADREITLVDAGLGDHFTDKERQIYAIASGVDLKSSLADVGIRPEEVTRVIFTHLHFDHFCGALTADGDALKPSFPQAIHCVQEGEWRDALEGRSLMKVSYRVDELRLLQQQVELRFLRGDTRLTPYLATEVTGGHTEHHQSVAICAAGRTLIYPADILPTRHHLRPYWGTAYDMFPFQTLIRKRQLVAQACDEGWIVAWNHDPQSCWSRLRREGEGYVAEAVEG